MNIKDTLTSLNSELDHGDVARIADTLTNVVKRTDVYNILRGKSLKDIERVKYVIDATRKFIDEKHEMLG